MSTVGGMGNQFIPPDAPRPNPVGMFEQFVPTTTQFRDFFGFIHHFRLPASITPPTG
jgi:hypothetical protein